MTSDRAPRTVDASRTRGRTQRYATPRSAHATGAPRPDGFDPVDLLIATGAHRDPTLLPLRYQRMSADELGFFRGAAAIQAADLARGSSTTLEVQLCGDAHVANFGVFASPERQLVFDVNDFDETARGPFEWDVKRLAASAVVAARTHGLAPADEDHVGRVAADAYRTAMRQFARMPNLAVWYAALDLDNVFGELRRYFTDEHSHLVRDVLKTARGQRDDRVFAHLIDRTARSPRIASEPPLLVPLDELNDDGTGHATREFLHRFVRKYEASVAPERRVLLHRFTPVDAARKVVGVGSVGTRCFVVLLLGRDRRDPFFLQVKEAGASVLDVARDVTGQAAHGERVVFGQRLMQATPDPFLGSDEAEFPGAGPRSFYVRQLYDHKASVDLSRLNGRSLGAYTAVCAWALARAHARSGAPVEVASYLGSSTRFEDAIASYAREYADQNARDAQALAAAIAAGRVVAAR